MAGGHHSGALDQEGCLYLWGRSFTKTPDSAVPTAVQPSDSAQQAPPPQTQANESQLLHTCQPAFRWSQVKRAALSHTGSACIRAIPALPGPAERHVLDYVTKLHDPSKLAVL